MRFEVRRIDGLHILSSAAGEIVRTDDLGLVIGALSQALLERIRRSSDWLALIHGAAASLGGRAVGLPAPSGSGKTTLLAALLAAEFDYVADDLLALTPSGQAVPWPTPLSVKAGSWEIVGRLHPELADAPLYCTKGVQARLLLPPDSRVARSPVTLRALVFPRFEPGTAAALARLEPLDVLIRLLGDRIWLGHPLEEEKLRTFLEWLQRIPAFSLSYSSISDGVAAVRSAVE